MQQRFKVGLLQPSSVTVYEYYDPGRTPDPDPDLGDHSVPLRRVLSPPALPRPFRSPLHSDLLSQRRQRGAQAHLHRQRLPLHSRWGGAARVGNIKFKQIPATFSSSSLLFSAFFSHFQATAASRNPTMKFFQTKRERPLPARAYTTVRSHPRPHARSQPKSQVITGWFPHKQIFSMSG